MDVAIFLLYPRMRPHFETDLELAQRHLASGDSVTLVTCDGILSGCDSNPDHERAGCLKCIGRRKSGVGLIVGDVEEVGLRDWRTAASADVPTSFDSIAALKELRYEGFDWGDAVASSLISCLRDPWPDLNRHGELVQRLLRGAREVYLASRAFLAQRRPGRVYVFNGRMASARAVLRACQAESIDCCIHERGRDRRHFALYENHLPQEIEAVAERIERCWESSRDAEPQRIEVARRWYLRRAAGEETNWRSFTAGQCAHKTPADWRDGGRNLVLFTTSEDECAAVGGSWHAGPYADQISGLEMIAADWNRGPDRGQLFIRVHPNSAGLPESYLKRLERLAGRHVTVIGPRDDVDSYFLIRSADTVLAFNSTAGIEAVFWGRPSILIGNAFYRRLGSTYQPTSHVDLLRLMTTPLEPLSPHAALQYGYYWATLGEPYRYYDVDDLFRGRFQGRRVRPGWWDRLQIEWERRVGRWLRRAA